MLSTIYRYLLRLSRAASVRESRLHPPGPLFSPEKEFTYIGRFSLARVSIAFYVSPGTV